MSKIDDAPLIEAIFNITWGEVVPGQFNFTAEEQDLFAGKISAAASNEGFVIVENLQPFNNMKLPLSVTHRFRKEINTWPCIQIGLGIFTINQTEDDYAWASFKDVISQGMGIFNSAEVAKLENIRNTGKLSLKYQDAYFPGNKHTEKFLQEHSEIKVALPEDFLNNTNIDKTANGVNIRFNFDTINPKGSMNIMIANAVINSKPGLLIETIIESKLTDIVTNWDDSTSQILEWSELAHNLQQHSFKTLMNPSAYKQD